jgi:hypothetical protein
MSLVQNIRIVIADDTALYRKILTMAVEKIDGAEMVGSASDGVAVLELLKRTPCRLSAAGCVHASDGWSGSVEGNPSALPKHCGRDVQWGHLCGCRYDLGGTGDRSFGVHSQAQDHEPG